MSVTKCEDLLKTCSSFAEETRLPTFIFVVNEDGDVSVRATNLTRGRLVSLLKQVIEQVSNEVVMSN